ncbi:HAD-like domain-containing protein, partial [Pisolithus orientalis]|uniref:HAD-like domain-containing protein n=1 Tax=Pisolithus orientalis TaxID=936130 RepID=UPI0022248BD8
SHLPSLDFQPSEPEQTRTERTGAKSSKDSLSSIERKRRVLARLSLGLIAVGVGLQLVYLGRQWDEEELKAKKIKPQDAPSTRWGRMKTRIADVFGLFSEPVWPELLPPPLPPQYQKPYTIVISLDDLLVNSVWDRQHGWRIAKRPGVDYFLAYLSQFYEVVIFTSQYSYTALPIIEKLDPYGFFISHRLFREHMRSTTGTVVKDLSYLNRDLSKVIILDTDPDHVSTHPENAIILPRWTGNPGDKGLVAMIPFLESIGIYKPQDIRPILEAYHGKDIPIEYAKKEAEARQQHIAEWTKKRKGLSTGGFTFSSLFGASEVRFVSHSPIPPTYLEQKRTEAQNIYRQEQAYLQANKATLDKMLEEQKQQDAKEMSGTLWNMIAGRKQEDKGAVGGGAAVGGANGQTQNVESQTAA